MRVLNLRDLKVNGQIVLPSNSVRIDRATEYGNPYKIGSPHPHGCKHGKIGPMMREDVIDHYRWWLIDRLAHEPKYLEPLRGYDLVCWCWPEHCHGDIIIAFLTG